LGQPEAVAVNVTVVPDKAVPEGDEVTLTPVQGGCVVVNTYVLEL
jgi:sulfur carrier protein ThiS